MVSLDQNHLEKRPSTQVHIKMDNSNKANIGGWLTLPFIIGSIVGLSLAAGSWYANLTMFLMREYNIRESLAVKIYEIMNIGVNIFPIVGAVFSDSFFGSFFVINVSSFASLLGLVMLGLSTIIPSLRPHPCNNNSINFSIINTTCDTPSINQYAFLLVALLLVTLGFGCTRFLLSSLGAYQFNKPEHRRIFFNVYILAYEIGTSISYGVVVFIIQEQGKWSIGFGIGIAANIIAIIFFLLGSQYYRHIISQPNPFVGVVHALSSVTISKIKMALAKDYRVHNDEQISSLDIRSSIQVNESTQNKNTVIISTKSWTRFLSSSLKQAEDWKKIIRTVPVWSAGIVLSTVVTTSSNLVVSQASSMDLTISRRIKLPAESMTVFGLIATCVTLSIFDCFLFPMSQKITGRPLKPLQRGGVGHVFVVLGMMALATIEMARLNSIKTSNLMGHGANYINNGPIMSAYWLIFPMVLLGIGAAYYYPGGLTFSYQEFPKSLKSSSTAVPSIQVIIGFYLSKAFTKVVKHHSPWLNDDINRSRLDMVYWVLALVVAVNFGYYLVCTTLYKYNVQDIIDDESTNSTNVDNL